MSDPSDMPPSPWGEHVGADHSPDALDVPNAHEIERLLNLPERRALSARLRDVVRRGEPAYAVTDEDLGGAIAVIIRTPGTSPVSRLIVFGATTLNDAAVACARGALALSELSDLDVAQRRVITVWLDGRFEVREGDRRSAGHREWDGPSCPAGSAERLRAAAAAATTVHIADVGAARLVNPADT